MCVVSNVGDSWSKRVPERYPWINPEPTPQVYQNGPTQEEFNRLKAEVEELKKLLKAAKAFDEATDQPDCHTDEKVALIKKIAEYVGVDLADVFGN